MMGFFSNLFAKQNCAVCGKECGTLHRSKLRDGQFLCDDCGDQCSKYIRLSELTLDEAKEHMAYMARVMVLSVSKVFPLTPAIRP